MDIIDSDTKGTQNKTLIEKALKKVENSNCNSLKICQVFHAVKIRMTSLFDDLKKHIFVHLNV